MDVRQTNFWHMLFPCLHVSGDAPFQVFFGAKAPSGAVPDAHQHLLQEREESVSTRDLR